MDNSLQNNQLLKALCREPTEFVPVWVMRQAGRYLPEYLKIRYQTGDFLSLCKNPDLACEVALQPLKRFNLDAAILFSDILTIPDAMGLGLYFESGEGPKFRKTIRTERDIAKLSPIDVDTDLEYVTKAVRNIKSITYEILFKYEDETSYKHIETLNYEQTDPVKQFIRVYNLRIDKKNDKNVYGSYRRQYFIFPRESLNNIPSHSITLGEGK